MSLVIHRRCRDNELVVMASSPGAPIGLGTFEAAYDHVSRPDETLPWYWVARVKVHPRHRNSGLGTRITQVACDLADFNRIVMYLVPNPYDASISYDRLVEFYDRFGFTERVNFDNQGVVHVRRPR
jgi:GNAT superfamily N-acetyltransferase